MHTALKAVTLCLAVLAEGAAKPTPPLGVPGAVSELYLYTETWPWAVWGVEGGAAPQDHIPVPELSRD